MPDDDTEAVELKTHELDEAQVDPAAYAQLHDASGLKFTREPRNSFTGYALNVTSPILRDVRVRRALSMAVDRVGLAAKNTYGTAEPAYADLERLFWAPDGEPRNSYAYDPAAAAALLDAAGWRRGPSGVRRKDGVDLRLRVIDFIGSATGSRVDLQVEEAMKTLGVASDLKYFNAGVYFAPAKNRGIVNSGDFDVAALTLTADADSQNDEIYTCAARSPNGYNVSRYCSPDMDALQREALTTLDPKKRASEVVEIERLAVTDVPYIFLYHSTGRIFTNADVLRTPGNVNSDWYGLAKWRFAPD